MSEDPLVAGVQNDLQRWSKGDYKALGRLMVKKDDLETMWDKAKDYPWAVKAKELLKDIPREMNCSCCGLPLRHPHNKGGKIVGSECLNHEPKDCGRRRGKR